MRVGRFVVALALAAMSIIVACLIDFNKGTQDERVESGGKRAAISPVVAPECSGSEHRRIGNLLANKICGFWRELASLAYDQDKQARYGDIVVEEGDRVIWIGQGDSRLRTGLWLACSRDGKIKTIVEYDHFGGITGQQLAVDGRFLPVTSVSIIDAGKREGRAKRLILVESDRSELATDSIYRVWLFFDGGVERLNNKDAVQMRWRFIGSLVECFCDQNGLYGQTVSSRFSSGGGRRIEFSARVVLVPSDGGGGKTRTIDISIVIPASGLDREVTVGVISVAPTRQELEAVLAGFVANSNK